MCGFSSCCYYMEKESDFASTKGIGDKERMRVTTERRLRNYMCLVTSNND